MTESKPKRFRLKKHTVDAEVGDLAIAILMASRLCTWLLRRLRPMMYRPVALIGTIVFAVAYWLSPWATAIIALAITLVWPLLFPDSYLKRVAWRGPSFVRGVQLRFMPRRKFTGAKVLSKEEPLIHIDRVQKVGCTTVAVMTMPYGDTVPFWQEKADDLASAFNALEAVVNPYRKPRFTDLRPTGNFRFKLHPTLGLLRPPIVEFAFKPDLLRRPPFVKLEHTKTKKRMPRKVEVKFLDEDPFARAVDVDFLDLHRPLDAYAGAGPTGIDLDGLPYFEDDRMSTLWVALTGGGKTTAERCLIYADHERVQQRLVENWGADYAYGVELEWMKNQLARTEYGEDPEEVNAFWHDVRVLMQDRMRGMRGETTYFTPVPGDPLLKVYEDEALLLNLPDYAEVRNEVHRNKVAVLTNARKAGLQVRTFTQGSMKEEYPARDKYKITKVGILQRKRHVDIVAGEGAWASGMHANLLDPDPKASGIFYEVTQGARAAGQMRYGNLLPQVISNLPPAPPGMLGGKTEPPASERLPQGRVVVVDRR